MLSELSVLASEVAATAIVKTAVRRPWAEWADWLVSVAVRAAAPDASQVASAGNKVDLITVHTCNRDAWVITRVMP